MLNAPPNSKPKFENFCLEKYHAIVEYKTSHYTFCLPVHLAMHLVSLICNMFLSKSFLNIIKLNDISKGENGMDYAKHRLLLEICYLACLLAFKASIFF